jgi:general stress protein YciG
VSETSTLARKPRGFAALSPERRREIAASGGRQAHALGVAHQFTSDEARAAAQRRGAKAANWRAARAQSEAALKPNGNG